GVEPKRISDAALRVLSAFDFPGNVRQLENVCHWLTVMAPAQVIDVNDLPPEVLGAAEVVAADAPEAPSPVAAPVNASAVVPAPATLEHLPVTVAHAAGVVSPAQGSWEQ